MRAEISLNDHDIRRAIKEYVNRYYATVVPVDKLDLYIEHVWADNAEVSTLYCGKIVFSMDSVSSLSKIKREE